MQPTVNCGFAESRYGNSKGSCLCILFFCPGEARLWDCIRAADGPSKRQRVNAGIFCLAPHHVNDTRHIGDGERLCKKVEGAGFPFQVESLEKGAEDVVR